VFWVAIAIAVQGVTRLASSAIWGVISDRYGRKMMLLRSLYLASITFGFAAAATAPWHLAIALGCQGFFSGFVPASVALVSVSVPDSKLNSSLSTVTGAQYLGSTLGPAVGAALALVMGYRASILTASVVPMLAATLVLVMVPRDHVAARRRSKDDETPVAAIEPFKATRQFVLAVATLFIIYSMNELVRLATPIALKAIEATNDVKGEAGITFSIVGLASAVSVLVLAPRLFQPGRVRLALGLSCLMGAAGFAILAVTGTVPLYVAGYLLVALVISAMVPATNTLVAASVTRSRRGTGFGIAASVQALSFAVGPGGAAFFTAVSLTAGFAFLSVLFLALGVLLYTAVREPVT
jgi:DHA1 family multidrug resistance protein-like MFS transporter